MVTDYVDAERELRGFFTSSLGVAAQRYDSDHGSYDPNDAHLRLRNDSYRRALGEYGAIERTLACLDSETRKVLESVYAPHGWSGLLAIAFCRSLGKLGSFVGMAIHSKKASAAFAKRPESESDLKSVLDWLTWQVGRGHEARTNLLRAITEECNGKLLRALALYEPFRAARVEAERKRANAIRRTRESELRAELAGKKIRRQPNPDLMLVAGLVSEVLALEGSQ